MVTCYEDDSKGATTCDRIKCCWSTITLIVGIYTATNAFIGLTTSGHYSLSFTDPNIEIESCVIPALFDHPNLQTKSLNDGRSLSPIESFPYLICNDVRNFTGYIPPKNSSRVFTKAQAETCWKSTRGSQRGSTKEDLYNPDNCGGGTEMKECVIKSQDEDSFKCSQFESCGVCCPIDDDDSNEKTAACDSVRERAQQAKSMNFTGAWVTNVQSDGNNLPFYSFCPRNYNCMTGGNHWGKYGFQDYPNADTVFCSHKNLTCGNPEWCGQFRLGRRPLEPSVKCPSCENCMCDYVNVLWKIAALMSTAASFSLLAFYYECQSCQIGPEGDGGERCVLWFDPSRFCCNPRPKCLGCISSFWDFLELLVDIYVLILMSNHGVQLFFASYEESQCFGSYKLNGWSDARYELTLAREQSDELNWEIISFGLLSFTGIGLFVVRIFCSTTDIFA